MVGRTILAMAMALPAAALGHPGHGHSDLLVEVAEASQQGQVVRVSALISNLGDADVDLTGVLTQGALVEAQGFPLTIPADETMRFSADLMFSGTVPGILTLEFDFGAAGSGPVLVIPELEEASDV